MDADRTLLEDLMLSAGFGLIIAVLGLFLFGGLWASWTAGIVYCLSAMVFARMFSAPGHFATVIEAAVAGALSGLAWWTVADTTTSWWLPPAVGAAFVSVGMGIAEWRDWKLERDAVPYQPPQTKSGDGAV